MIPVPAEAEKNTRNAVDGKIFDLELFYLFFAKKFTMFVGVEGVQEFKGEEWTKELWKF
jgi:hypothetical protein